MHYSKIKRAMLMLSTAGIALNVSSCSDNTTIQNKENTDHIKPYTQGQLLTDAALQDYLNSIGMNVSALNSLKSDLNTSVLSALQSRFTVDSLRSAMITLNVETHKSEFIAMIDTVIHAHQTNYGSNSVTSVVFTTEGDYKPNLKLKEITVAPGEVVISVEVRKQEPAPPIIIVKAEVGFKCC